LRGGFGRVFVKYTYFCSVCALRADKPLLKISEDIRREHDGVDGDVAGQ
jgi:hypothetical protein